MELVRCFGDRGRSGHGKKAFQLLQLHGGNL
jgi:hypothetical protein